jgi:hypothetical protein
VTERLPEPAAPSASYEPVGPSPELARRNVRLGIALFVVALLIAGGAVAISFVYLHYD